MSLQEILEQVNALTPDEQRQLRNLLDEMLAQQQGTTKLAAFHQALLASGLVKTIKPARSTKNADRKLMQVKGEPISQTIIEERG